VKISYHATKDEFLHFLFHLFVFLLAGVSFLIGCAFVLMGLIFLTNFNVSNSWHVFVLISSFSAPVLALAGSFVYAVRTSWKTAIFSILASLFVGAVYLMWGADASNGLAH
jgi:hypothetical protein